MITLSHAIMVNNSMYNKQYQWIHIESSRYAMVTTTLCINKFGSFHYKCIVLSWTKWLTYHFVLLLDNLTIGFNKCYSTDANWKDLITDTQNWYASVMRVNVGIRVLFRVAICFTIHAEDSTSFWVTLLSLFHLKHQHFF